MSRPQTAKLRPSSTEPPLLVVSVGCPAGIGPEVSLAAAATMKAAPCVLVCDRETLELAADVVGVSRRRLIDFSGESPAAGKIAVHAAGPKLAAGDRRPGRPSRRSGEAQLAYIETAYELVRDDPGRRALVTGPVSKEAIARSGLARARDFRGHTEWLRELDGAKKSVMCFAADKLVTSVVTTHVPLSRVSSVLDAAGVRDATVELGRLLLKLGVRSPKIAVASLNPHAGESELLGDEERTAIVPGIRAARRVLGAAVTIVGPIGAETAYRRAVGGSYAGVVAMYHDQATIPMKIVAFGDAVNVTLGLGIVRTSVDHGTAYDIAWKGEADARGMSAAMRLAARLIEQPKRRG